jgi:hypothetical protein
MRGRVTTSSTNSNTFQYRDDRRTHIKQVVGKRRWVDKGLGKTYGAINKNCQALATDNLKKNVAARTLVISPEMSFMQALPEARRIPVLAELTEAPSHHRPARGTKRQKTRWSSQVKRGPKKSGRSQPCSITINPFGCPDSPDGI